MKAVVNRDTCIGCELCASVCAEVFAMDEDGMATVIQETLSKEAEACAIEAKDQCPVDAIIVE